MIPSEAYEYLDGRTPEEVYNHSPPKEFLKLIHAYKIPEMKLHISYLEGRKHLPSIELNKVA